MRNQTRYDGPVSLRSIAAVMLLGLLLAVSYGGTVCEALCIPAGGRASTGHACCPEQVSGHASTPQCSPQAACHLPLKQEAASVQAPVTLLPLVEFSMLPQLRVSLVSGASKLIASDSASPPRFHLRI
jgi:hypothetical protein